MKIELNKTHGTLFDKFKFCMAAWDKTAGQQVAFELEKVMIKDNQVYVTDGHRLHIAKVEPNWKNGLYEVIKNNKTSIVLLLASEDMERYPKTEMITGMKFKEAKEAEHNFISLHAQLTREIPEQYCIDPDFIKPLAENVTTYTLDDSEKMVKLNGKDNQAYIMLRKM